MKHLKMADPQWAGYTGMIGPVMFKDGVSTYPVDDRMRLRLGASIRLVEVDADGNEDEAGGAAIMVREGGVTARIAEPTIVQTDAEKEAELAADAAKEGRPPVDKFFTGEELEQIADAQGIEGLRAVAAPWGVKDRKIVTLIQEILRAQADFLKNKAPTTPVDTREVDEDGVKIATNVNLPKQLEVNGVILTSVEIAEATMRHAGMEKEEWNQYTNGVRNGMIEEFMHLVATGVITIGEPVDLTPAPVVPPNPLVPDDDEVELTEIAPDDEHVGPDDEAPATDEAPAPEDAPIITDGLTAEQIGVDTITPRVLVLDPPPPPLPAIHQEVETTDFSEPAPETPAAD